MKDFILRYWLELIFSIIVTSVTVGLTKIKNEFKCEKREQKAIKDGLQALLRDQLIKSYNYFMDKGEMQVHDKDNIRNMWEQYHALGANGVMDDLIKEMMALPVYRKKEGKE